MKNTIRTFPVRVDIELAGGRTQIILLPEQLTIHDGEAIEWDFRYFGGSDVLIEEIVIEFPDGAPFSKSAFRSKRPPTARPHRIVSGPATVDDEGTIEYVIRCYDAFKSEIATGKPRIVLAG